MPKNDVDITGRKFGKLTAIKLLRRDSRSKQIWLCKCDCGNYCEIRKDSLTSGHTKSCGCFYDKVQERVRNEFIIYGTFAGEIIRKKQQKGIKRATNTSGTTGVSFFTHNKKWYAELTYRGRHYRKGFIKKEDAIAWRKKLENELDIYSPDGIKK